MANIRKQFNFRNGVQVDDDNLVVSPTGLVGIGTTIPTEALDVRGIAKVVGLVTASQIYTPNLTATNLTIDSLVLGDSIIGGGVSIRSGIITASGTGVVTYYGDGGRLLNLPTSQWLDSDVGLGFTSIYSQGFVGVGTNDPRFLFQVSGTNITTLGGFESGVGFSSEGNILATGIVTASKFVGVGSDLTGLNASNIAYGTIDNDRIPTLLNSKLPSNISVSGIITATGGFIGTVSGTLYGDVIGNVTGNLTGNVTGIASTARSLTGNPNIVVNNVTATSIAVTSIVNATSIGSTNINLTGVATAPRFDIGVGGTTLTLTSSSSVGKIGIGSAIPTKEIEIVKNGSASIELVSTDVSRLILGQQTTTGIGVGQSTAVIRFGNYSKTFDLINGDQGDFNYYLHTNQPVAGFETGRFNWIYGQTNAELMSLTYGGRLGIGITNPDNTIHVVGTSTVTGNSWFGGDINVVGNISVGGNVTGNIVASEAQKVFATSGVSTFYDVFVGNDITILGSVGIGTTSPTAAFDAYNVSALFGNVGVGTTSLGSAVFKVNGPSILNSIAIGNTTNVSSSLLVYEGTANFDSTVITGINSSTLTLDSTCLVGIGTTVGRSAVDFSDAGKDSLNGTYSFMIPPRLTTTERSGLSTVAGAFIFNTTTNKFQGYTGVAWTDFH